MTRDYVVKISALPGWVPISSLLDARVVLVDAKSRQKLGVYPLRDLIKKLE